MPTAILWLTLLLILTIIVIYVMNYTSVIPTLKQEGFTVKTCPSDTTSYITHDGFTNCCSGEVIDNHCEKIVCSLSPGSPVRSCTTYGLDLIARNDANYCKPEFTGDCSKYFTNSEGTVRGCSKSNLNPSRTGPSDLSQPYCRLYNTADANKSNYDSCENYLIRYNSSEILSKCNSDAAAAAKTAKDSLDKSYSDAAAAAKTARDSLESCNSNVSAIQEARTKECSRFNEAKYLELNPDVKAAVEKKQIPSGKWHYANQALPRENRRVC